MKITNNKKKLIITAFAVMILMALFLLYLYCTNRIDYILNFQFSLLYNSLSKIEKWLTGKNLFAMILVGLFISFLSNKFLPTKENKIKKNTDTILQEQKKQYQKLNQKIDDVLENIKLDPKDIEIDIKKLPITQGIDEVKNIINELLTAKKINQKTADSLLIPVEAIFEQNKELSKEISKLKREKQNKLAQTLELRLKNMRSQKGYGYTGDIKKFYVKNKKQNIIIKSIKKETKSLFAYFLQKFNFFSKSSKKYEEALKIYRDLAKNNPKTYLPYVAGTLNNLANLHSNTQKLNLALKNYEEALKIRRDLAKDNPKTYLPYVATTLNNLALLHSKQQKLNLALDEFKEALKIYKNLSKDNPKTYLPDVATILNNLANLHSDTQNLNLALDEFKEALKIRRDLAKDNPKTYLPYVAMTLNNLANLHSDTQNLNLALDEFKEALKIYRNLSKDNPKTYMPYVATILNNLANLHSDTQNLNLALGEYEEALKIYKNLSEDNPKTYLPDVATTLNNLALLHLNKQELNLALKKNGEALKIYKNLSKNNPQAYEIDYAQTLITGAVLLKKENTNLEIAKNILKKYPQVPKAQYLLKTIETLR